MKCQVYCKRIYDSENTIFPISPHNTECSMDDITYRLEQITYTIHLAMGIFVSVASKKITII